VEAMEFKSPARRIDANLNRLEKAMAYNPFETDLFAKQFRQLCKKDKPLERKLTDTINDIIKNPENFDSTLQGERFRCVKKKAVRERYRIVYRYCERCLVTANHACDDCAAQKRPATSIIFEEVFNRDEGY
jgi:hypothetical protein